jgi:hypothetical protein
VRATLLVSLDPKEPIIAVEQVDAQLHVATATSIEQVVRDHRLSALRNTSRP